MLSSLISVVLRSTCLKVTRADAFLLKGAKTKPDYIRMRHVLMFWHPVPREHKTDLIGGTPS